MSSGVRDDVVSVPLHAAWKTRPLVGIVTNHAGSRNGVRRKVGKRCSSNCHTENFRFVPWFPASAKRQMFAKLDIEEVKMRRCWIADKNYLSIKEP